LTYVMHVVASNQHRWHFNIGIIAIGAGKLLNNRFQVKIRRDGHKAQIFGSSHRFVQS